MDIRVLREILIQFHVSFVVFGKVDIFRPKKHRGYSSGFFVKIVKSKKIEIGVDFGCNFDADYDGAKSFWIGPLFRAKNRSRT